MNYKVMKRPMFKMGGPTSGGTGITSGLETPRQNFNIGTYKEAVQAIPESFTKMRTGLENQKSAIGPMALYQALSGGALEGVTNFGDLAMAFGNPAVLESIAGGMAAQNKLDTQIDSLNLKEATTMATLLKKKDPNKTYDFAERLKAADGFELQIKNYVTKQTEGLKGDVLNKKLEELQLDPFIQNLEKKIDFVLREMSLDEYLFQSRLKAQEMDTLFDINEATKEYYEIKNRGKYFAEGGRINKQMGGGFNMAQEQPMQAAQTMAPGPEMMQPQGQDPFTILRSRLPKEISDEVVSLIAYNKKAFADFANIQDQDDVDLFNQKYNVQLVVDLASR